ncbi:MAG TPA: hypothetical protein IAD22_03180 [Candidatus Limousia pullorum]|uniref:Uncharacterized protein n=1 Tax=Candidatus Limousia pullorum TaxID=2840860 RepID=A0A9D1LXS5_9FIRM|nr:hypothetical protein [Candidatus Limousia pullorum]
MTKGIIKFFSVLLVFTMAFGCVSATEIKDVDEQNNNFETVITEAFVDENLIGTTLESKPSRSGPYGESHEVVDTEVIHKTVYVTPDGQPSGGYWGDSSDEPSTFVFFFEAEGSNKEISFTAMGKYFTTQVKVGKMTTSGSGMGKVMIRDPYNRYQLELIKYYTINVYKVNIYKYGMYQSTYYRYDSSYSLDSRWVKVS